MASLGPVPPPLLIVLFSCGRDRTDPTRPPSRSTRGAACRHHGGDAPAPRALRRRHPPRRRVRRCPAARCAASGAGPRPRTSSRSCPRASTTSRSARRSTQARGFCAPPRRAVLDADRARAGSLGASILLRATLVGAAARRGGGHRARAAGRVARASPTRGGRPACPACERVADGRRRSVETVVRLAADRRWARGGGRSRRSASRTSWRSWTCGRPRRRGRRSRRGRSRGSRRCATGSPRSPTPRRTTGGTSRPTTSARRSTRPRTSSAVRARSGGRGGAAAPPVGDGVAAVLLTGVYGSGKTTLAIELVDRLDARGRPRRRDRPRLARLVRRADWLGRARRPAAHARAPRADGGALRGRGRRSGSCSPGRSRPAPGTGMRPRSACRSPSCASRSAQTRCAAASRPTPTARARTISPRRSRTSQDGPRDDGADWTSTRTARPRTSRPDVLDRLGWA